jgi:hypothetical protein
MTQGTVSTGSYSNDSIVSKSKLSAFDECMLQSSLWSAQATVDGRSVFSQWRSRNRARGSRRDKTRPTGREVLATSLLRTGTQSHESRSLSFGRQEVSKRPVSAPAERPPKVVAAGVIASTTFSGTALPPLQPTALAGNGDPGSARVLLGRLSEVPGAHYESARYWLNSLSGRLSRPELEMLFDQVGRPLDAGLSQDVRDLLGER